MSLPRPPSWDAFNRWLGGIALVLIGAIVVQVIAFAAGNRYHYAVTACEPPGFPVHAWIELADAKRTLLHYDTRTSDTAMEIWGEPSWLAAGDRLALPSRIDVQFVALQERRYYRASLALPPDAMGAAFTRAARDDASISISMPDATRAQGLTFAVCFANDGGVAVWLRGRNFQQPLLKRRLNPSAPPTGALDFGRPMALDQFISQHFQQHQGQSGTGVRDDSYSVDSSRDWLMAPTGWPERNPEPRPELEGRSQ